MAEQVDAFAGGGETAPAKGKRGRGEARAPRWITIPAGKRPARCSGKTCGALMYWVEGVKGPVSTDFEGGQAPTATEEGRGQAHHINCPDRPTFDRSADRKALQGGRK